MSVDLHALRSRDAALDALADAIQREVVACAASRWADVGPRLPRCVAVTGSSGYLGATLVGVLQALGVATRGLDVVPSPATTDIVGSVTDPVMVSQLVGEGGCTACVHTAALHAPHAGSHSEEEFVAVNLGGTSTLLRACTAAGLTCVVHTSTTSLMITQAVKEREVAGQCLFLKVLPLSRSRWHNLAVRSN